MGNAQLLANGHLFVGWGGQPQFSEYTRTGRQIFNGTFPLGALAYQLVRTPVTPVLSVEARSVIVVRP